jgi:ribosome-binding protein aMBF1 (putative translation factor)
MFFITLLYVRNKKHQIVLTKVGEIVKKQRVAQGYSRTQLAIELNSDEKQIRRIENGEVNPTFITLLKIFHILKMDFDVLGKIKIDKSFFYD